MWTWERQLDSTGPVGGGLHQLLAAVGKVQTDWLDVGREENRVDGRGDDGFLAKRGCEDSSALRSTHSIHSSTQSRLCVHTYMYIQTSPG